VRRMGLALALLALPALAADAPPPSPAPAAPLIRLLQLFPDLSAPAIRLNTGARPSETLRIRQPGDPDSVVSPGSPGLSNEIRFLPALEINDILLKAYKPDPALGPADSRFRAAGAFCPLDEHGRPYQLRFGARLVW